MRKYNSPPTPDPKDFGTAYREAIEGGVVDLPLNLSEIVGKMYENDDFQVDLARLADVIETHRDLTANALRVKLNDIRNLFQKRIREASGSRTTTKKTQETA